MSTKQRGSIRRLSRCLCVSAGLLSLFATIGCETPMSQIRVTSRNDPFFPEPYDINLPRAVFYQDQRADRHCVADSSDPSIVTENGATHMLHVHLDWNPRPGRNWANKTTRDATFLYIVRTEAGAAAYEGAGFAYPAELPDGTMQLDIETGRLRLITIEGSPDENIGNAMLRGRLFAIENREKTVERQRIMERIAAGLGE